MRILVTGAGGFVGGYLTRELIAHGHAVRALDVRKADIDDVEWIVGDLRDLAVVERAVTGVDIVCHLGAIPATRPREVWPDIVDINIRGTYHVLEAMARHGLRRIVFASSACVIGGACNWNYRPKPAYLPMDEDAVGEPDEPYSLSKIVNEQTARMFQLHGFLDTSIALRFWNVRDAVVHGLGFLHIPTLGMAAVHPHDAVQALRLALESDLVGFHAFSMASRWRYNEDGTREDPAETRRIVRETGFDGIEFREGFPEAWQSCGSSSKANAVLGYDPEF